ncbi:hypothetical protein ACTFQF_00305 [Aliivibrio fischeri]|uniref:Uncharacterized protein n=1 Tax=Aliivibrio fischeri (strain MJ11) TaxID=388396 RepID=B5EW02_ALIFM|nr:hypothetical protein [Aliivibrio fischeri]ACH64738.1 conserved hypothetical protein [Aliivibrio fischeri MJ11]MUK37498.1 hypothetical protein [Aliivibrio fischeri]
MSIVFHQVKEGEFRRLAETKTMTKILAQESSEIPNKFHLVGIDQVNGIGYAVRHGRTAELRVWRIDILVNQARDMGFQKIDVQLQ